MQRRNKGALRRCFCACGLSLLLCAACSGCALLDTLARWVESGVSGEPYVSREEQIYIETAESFLDAVAREDRAAVRALFSENVRETDEDFDAQLDLLFEADLDASAFWDRDDIQLQGSYRHDDGRHAAVVQDTFPIRDRGRYYWCTLELTYTDDFDPGEVGITALAFYSAEYYCALLYEAADAEWPAGSGLDVRTAYPADGDIRAAGGSPYRFENDTPPLEEDAGARLPRADGQLFRILRAFRRAERRAGLLHLRASKRCGQSAALPAADRSRGDRHDLHGRRRGRSGLAPSGLEAGGRRKLKKGGFPSVQGAAVGVYCCMDFAKPGGKKGKPAGSHGKRTGKGIGRK